MPRKFLSVVLPSAFLFLLACASLTFDLSAPTAAATRPALTAIVPYANPPARPSSTPSRTPAPFPPSPAVLPRWVAEFSEPILKSLAGKYPTYRDDFSAICISDEQKPKVKICSTPESRAPFQEDIWSLPVTARPTLDLQPDLRSGYAYLNTGWWFDMPGDVRNPHLAKIDDGALLLTLPEGNLRDDLGVYNPNLMARNFVLQFDVEFGETQPDDAFRFQFEQGGAQRIALELTKGKTWAFYRGADSSEPAGGGVYEFFAFPRVRVLLIVRETECAVYLNNLPTVYAADCRADPSLKITKKSASFHLLSQPGRTASLRIDDAVFWDLGKDAP